MLFREVLKSYRDIESDSFADSQSFLDALEGPDLDEFNLDLKIRRWKQVELALVWIASGIGIFLGIILLLASNGASLWYSTSLLCAGLVSAVYTNRRVVQYLEWFRDISKKNYDLDVEQKES